jgi:hypothetical protein
MHTCPPSAYLCPPSAHRHVVEVVVGAVVDFDVVGVVVEIDVEAVVVEVGSSALVRPPCAGWLRTTIPPVPLRGVGRT